MFLSDADLQRIWDKHCHHGGDVISFGHDIEKIVLASMTKTLEREQCPALWVARLRQIGAAK